MIPIFHKFSVLLVALSLLCSSCSRVSTSSNSITIKTDSKDAPYVRLEVVSAKIIRVSAGKDKKLSRDRSLCVISDDKSREVPKWSHRKAGDTIYVTTGEIQARASLSSGLVSFYRTDGTPLLSERGRAISEFSDEGTTIYQSWNRTTEEAFYGLGQHQSDEFNWAGRNEKLIQYNTKVTIPFLTSSKGYGILWDNYSMSRFGDPRDYAQIGEVFTLYRPDGSEGALEGTYTAADGHKVSRDEPILYLEHAQALEKYLIRDFPIKGSNVVYEGFLEPSESGLFRFMTYYSGYIRVWIGGQEVVKERWRTAWNPNTYKFDVEMSAGQRTPLRIEWRPDGDVAYCSLRVLSPPDEDEPKTAFWSECGDIIDYYFVAGEDLDEVISGYRTLTGKAPVMPKWSMGFWQCRERYKSSQDIYDVVQRFEKDKMPLDMIIQDWQYWEEDQWGSHEFDLSRYPDPRAMVDSVHASGVKCMISVWPKFYLGTEHFDEFDREGWMYRQAVRDSIRDWVGPGYVGSFYDAYSSGARELFWRQMSEHLFPLGIDAWWMDASEPNIRDCVDMDYWKALCNPTALGSSTKYLNAYGLMNAQAIYEGQRSESPARVLLLTRSGFAGVQRYSTAIWSGDIASRWEDMKAQIPAGINFSMAGVPWWSMDIGGFCVEDRYSSKDRSTEDTEQWRELQTRWHQFGAFVPFFRVHGQAPAREYYNIAPKGHPARESMTFYTRLRYTLLPYIYSLAGKVWKDDYTIMRGLAMDFPNDAHALSVGDEYMFGPALLVAPVYEYKARSREVYLPGHEGGWYDFYSGRKVSAAGGESIIAEAPYTRIPLFVPAGSIIPMDMTCAGQDFLSGLQHSMDQDASKIKVKVYPGADGSFEIYEDAGDDYSYEEGAYTTISLKWDDAAAHLEIGATQGSHRTMPSDREFIVEIAGAVLGD